jgi:hypothetical protein
MFWFQKLSAAFSSPARYGLSLSGSSRTQIFENDKENFYHDKKAFPASRPDAGIGNDNLSGGADAALRP